MLNYIITECGTDILSILEKNVHAITFYQRRGLELSGAKTFEEGTAGYLVQLVR